MDFLMLQIKKSQDSTTNINDMNLLNTVTNMKIQHETTYQQIQKLHSSIKY